MATGFSSMLSLEGVQDAIYDYCCTICEDGGLNAEASFYCKNCSKRFCDACLKFHDKVNKKHKVFGANETDKWGKVTEVTPAIMCELHPEKEEEMFCFDHDRVCCLICMKDYHSRCEGVEHLLDVVEGIHQRPEFKSFCTEATDTQARLVNTLEIQENKMKLLQLTRNEMKSCFNRIKNNVCQLMDKLEDEACGDMDRHFFFLEREIQLDRELAKEFDSKLQRYVDDIQNLGKRSEKFAFQCFKKGEQEMFNAKQFLLSIKDESYQLQFTQDECVKDLSSSLQTLGKFIVIPEHLGPDYVFRVDKKQSFEIRTKADECNCLISGICKLTDGQTVIVDRAKKKVKLLTNLFYSVITELDLLSVPEDICVTAGNELVVTANKEKGELHFISAMNDNLTHTRSVSLHHWCYGLSCNKDQIYLCSDNAVYVYTLQGLNPTMIFNCKSGLDKLAVSDDKIYITKAEKCRLITLDISGKKLSALDDTDLKSPIGVCVANNGTVFVCGEVSCSIIQVDNTGCKKMNILTKPTDEVNFPYSMFYDRKSRSLLVGQFNVDNLLELKLC